MAEPVSAEHPAAQAHKLGEESTVGSMSSPGSSAASSRDQLELTPAPRCDYCGPLGWTIKEYGRETHKCGCPYRIHTYCQIHRQVCDEFTDMRNGAWRRDA